MSEQGMSAQLADLQLMALGDLGVLAFILAGALVGGFVNGLTGFGTALTGLPLWLQAVEPVLAAQLASACSITGHASTISTVWGAVSWRRLAPLAIAGLIGVPLGTLVLPLISLGTFKLWFGVLLVAYCTYMLFAASRAQLPAGPPLAERRAAAVVGFAGGVLGGLAGLSGVLLTVWASLKRWPKDEKRLIFQAFNFTLLAAMLVASAVQGLVGARAIVAFVIATPGTLLGVWLGNRVYKRLDDVRFDLIVHAVLLISGLGLVWSTF
jgi:uncharacterized membrane protein YfcA